MRPSVLNLYRKQSFLTRQARGKHKENSKRTTVAVGITVKAAVKRVAVSDNAVTGADGLFADERCVALEGPHSRTRASRENLCW
jgi:hypothetical protein